MNRRAFFGKLLAAAAGEVVLRERMNAFAATWNRFVAGANTGVFDAGLARKLSRQFREIEGCGMWPKENG